MAAPAALRSIHDSYRAGQRDEIAADLAAMSNRAIDCLARRGAGTTREVAVAEQRRRDEGRRRGMLALYLAILGEAGEPEGDTSPTCPICGSPLVETELGDFVCESEHREPRWFAREEVAA